MLLERPSAGLVTVYCVSRGLSVCVAVTVNPCACALPHATSADTSPSSIPRRSISRLLRSTSPARDSGAGVKRRAPVPTVP